MHANIMDTLREKRLWEVKNRYCLLQKVAYFETEPYLKMLFLLLLHASHFNSLHSF